MKLNTPEAVRAKIGQEVGVSDWVEITQELVDRFADVTDDHYFMHVDPSQAARTPVGGTIAHGFLLLSLFTKLGRAADVQLEGVVSGVNFGFEKARLLAPVRTGRRIRGRFVLKDLTERAPGQWLTALTVTLDLEGSPMPALVADWLVLQYVQTPAR